MVRIRQKAKNKFNARAVKDNSGFRVADSQIEREYEKYLVLLQKAGKITDLEKWPTVQLTPGIKWKLDFRYTDLETGIQIYVDTKGKEGERFGILCQLWAVVGIAQLRIVKKDYRKSRFNSMVGAEWKTTKTINPDYSISKKIRKLLGLTI